MNWLKIKCTLRQEFVIVGWTTSKAKGRPFASLVLAQNSADGWRYAGRVGTGFGADVLEDLGKKMAPLAQNTAALDVPREMRRGVHWVKPELVRSEEHTSELQSLMRISYAVFCLKKKK